MGTESACFIFAFTIVSIQIGCVHSETSLDLPEISKQPRPFEILFQVESDGDAVNRSFIIECEARSNHSLQIKYRWTKNGNKFNWTTSDGRISPQNGKGTLVFSTPRDEDAGQYQCFAETDDGVATSNSVFLRKAILPHFPENETRDIIAYEGTTMNISCGFSSSGYPKPTFYWTHKTLDSKRPSGRVKSSATITVDPDGTLWLFNLSISELGSQFIYLQCCAENSFSYDTSCGNGANLTIMSDRSGNVDKELKITFANANGTKVEAHKGHSVDLWCIATGIPIPEIKWRKKSGSLPNRIEYKNNRRTLTIKDVDFDDEGTYICEVENALESKDNYIKLSIFAKPEIIVEPLPKFNEKTSKGEIIFKMQCSAEGWPKPEIKWIYNGKEKENQRIENSYLQKRRNKNDFTVTEDGNYGCNASNQHGYIYKEVILRSRDILSKDLDELRERYLPNRTELLGALVTLNCDMRYPSILRRKNVILRKSYYTLNHSDAGEYNCQILHPYETVNKTFLLTVVDTIQFVTKPEDQGVFPGSTVTFRCAVSTKTDYQLNIFWLHKNLSEINYAKQTRFSVRNENYYVPVTTDNNRWKFRKNSTLTIENVTDSDSDLYYCVFNSKNVKTVLTVRNINTWRCDKSHIDPDVTKHACLNDLHIILNSSNSDLNATVVINTLEKLTESFASNLSSNVSQYSEQEILTTANLARDVTFKTEEYATNSDWKEIVNTTLKVFGDLLTNRDKWTRLNESEKPHVFTEFLDVMDSTSLNLAEKVTKEENSSKTFNFTKDLDSVQSVVAVLGVSKSEKNEFNISADDKAYPHKNSISVQTQNSSESQSYINYAVTMIQSSDIENIVNSTLSFTKNERDGGLKQLNGKMISFNSSVKLKKPKVRIEFAHNVKAVYNPNPKNKFRRRLHPGEKRKAILGNSTCAFWDTKAKSWSTEGCKRNKSDNFVTVCDCDHLTAFSVLTGFHEYSGKDFGLQILTWILCPLSIVCLSLSLSAFLLEKQGRSDKTKINAHLCVSLICGNVFLLLGDKDTLHLSDVTCTIFGVLTHFTWLCAFGWMAVEGIHLYIQVVKVFPPTTNNLFKIYCAVGYGIPFILVAITFTIGFIKKEDIYVGEMFCWLTGHYVWAFLAPALLIALGNICVLIRAISIAGNRHQTKIAIAAANKRSEPDSKTKYYRMKKLIRGSLSLTFILGVSWLFGVFTLIDFQGHILFAYVFTILNASQGTFIFIFHYQQIRQVTSRLMTNTTFSSSKSTEKTDDGKPKSVSEAIALKDNPKFFHASQRKDDNY